MPPSRKQQVVDLLKSLETKDPVPFASVNPTKYIQHNLQVGPGPAGVAALIQNMPPDAWVNTIRVFEDGDYVFAHTEYIDTLPTLVWCTRPDGSMEFLNKRWHDYTGCSPEESRVHGWRPTVHPQDLPRVIAKGQELLASGQSGEVEARIRRHDGVFRWSLMRVERERFSHPEGLEELKEQRAAGLSRGLPFELEHRARRKDGEYRWSLVRFNPFRDEMGMDRSP